MPHSDQMLSSMFFLVAVPNLLTILTEAAAVAVLLVAKILRVGTALKNSMLQGVQTIVSSIH